MKRLLKKALYIYLAIASNIFAISKGQATIVVMDKTILNGGTLTGGCTDSTGATATANLIYTSDLVPKVANYRIGQSVAVYRSAFSLTNTGSGAATYNTSTGVFNMPTFAQYVPVINSNVTRALNSAYTVSATEPAFLCYSIQISVTLALSSLTGTVTLQYSTNGGSTYVSLPKVAFAPPAAGLGLLTSQIVQVNGYVPANALVKITTTTIAGITYTYSDGQETY